jgi:biopolymer transport protein ExbD
MLIRSEETEVNTHVDFVPMVDVLFNLLIFFLLATSLKQAEREMHIALPAARAPGPISAALKEIVVNVDSQGRSIVAGKVVSPEELTQMIQTAVAANPEQKVSIRGDRRSPYENIVNVLDICKGAGVQEPFLDTIKIGD